jgi:hypothetical protein
MDPRSRVSLNRSVRWSIRVSAFDQSTRIVYGAIGRVERFPAGHLVSNDANYQFYGGAVAELVDSSVLPSCESFLTKGRLNMIEPFYPLAACVCRERLPVRCGQYVARKYVFSTHAFFVTFQMLA